MGDLTLEQMSEYMNKALYKSRLKPEEFCTVELRGSVSLVDQMKPPREGKLSHVEGKFFVTGFVPNLADQLIRDDKQTIAYIRKIERQVPFSQIYEVQLTPKNQKMDAYLKTFGGDIKINVTDFSLNIVPHCEYVLRTDVVEAFLAQPETKQKFLEWVGREKDPERIQQKLIEVFNEMHSQFEVECDGRIENGRCVLEKHYPGTIPSYNTYRKSTMQFQRDLDKVLEYSSEPEKASSQTAKVERRPQTEEEKKTVTVHTQTALRQDELKKIEDTKARLLQAVTDWNIDKEKNEYWFTTEEQQLFEDRIQRLENTFDDLAAKKNAGEDVKAIQSALLHDIGQYRAELKNIPSNHWKKYLKGEAYLAELRFAEREDVYWNNLSEKQRKENFDAQQEVETSLKIILDLICRGEQTKLVVDAPEEFRGRCDLLASTSETNTMEATEFHVTAQYFMIDEQSYRGVQTRVKSLEEKLLAWNQCKGKFLMELSRIIFEAYVVCLRDIWKRSQPSTTQTGAIMWLLYYMQLPIFVAKLLKLLYDGRIGVTKQNMMYMHTQILPVFHRDTLVKHLNEFLPQTAVASSISGHIRNYLEALRIPVQEKVEAIVMQRLRPCA